MASRRALGVVALALGALVLLAYGYALSTGRFVTGLAGIAFGAFMIAVGASLVRHRSFAERVDSTAAAKPAWAGTPVDLPPEEYESREGPIQACLRCGSTDLRPLTLGDGLFAGGGEMLSWVCARCAWRGQALLLDSATAYREFVRALHEERAEPR